MMFLRLKTGCLGEPRKRSVRLNQPVQKNPIETTVAKFDAILMVFAEGVHRLLQVVRYQYPVRAANGLRLRNFG